MVVGESLGGECVTFTTDIAGAATKPISADNTIHGTIRCFGRNGSSTFDTGVLQIQAAAA
jgi:hypothetical protein